MQIMPQKNRTEMHTTSELAICFRQRPTTHQNEKCRVLIISLRIMIKGQRQGRLTRIVTVLCVSLSRLIDGAV